MKQFLISLVLLVTAAPLAAQSPNDVDWNERLRELSFRGDRDTVYRLGPGDLLAIKVFGVEEFDQEVRVNGEGAIELPLLGTVRVEGMSASQLDKQLEEKLRDGGFIREPEVSVEILEFLSKPVFVLGSVQQPGQYQMTQPLRLIDVLAMAGGLDQETASGTVMVQTGEKDLEGAEISRNIDLTELLEEGNRSLNIPIQGGDVIHVKERRIQFVYVVGEVNDAGEFQIPEKGNLKVSQAVAMAGGAMKTAKANDARLLRYTESGERREITLRLDDIYRGKAPDLSMEPEDVVYVPGSTFKNVAGAILGIVPYTISRSIIGVYD